MAELAVEFNGFLVMLKKKKVQNQNIFLAVTLTEPIQLEFHCILKLNPSCARCVQRVQICQQGHEMASWAGIWWQYKEILTYVLLVLVFALKLCSTFFAQQYGFKTSRTKKIGVSTANMSTCPAHGNLSAISRDRADVSKAAAAAAADANVWKFANCLVDFFPSWKAVQ